MSAPAPRRSSSTLVVGASALGTLFEWYDFFLYGSLAGFIAAHFFSGVGETTGFILALATFAVGFVVRPAGALLFGRIGDRRGRKNTFLVTLALMGLSTFLVGVLPGYGSLGLAAPLGLVLLRILQGLAIGGEFAGAITYVAEHAPPGRRGLHTSFIPASSMGGLLLSLIVIAATRGAMDPGDFADYGWRIPFLISILLLGISLWIRLKLHESPAFSELRARGGLSKAPLAESFLRWPNLRIVLVALFGCVAGQAVMYYTGTFYALFFLERMAKVDILMASLLMAVALAAGALLVIAFGWLSDRVGRKPVMVGGMAIALVAWFPLFEALMSAANPALARAREESPVVLYADTRECSLQFDPVGRRRFDASACDLAKAQLARAGVSHETRALAAGGGARLDVGGRSIGVPDPRALPPDARDAAIGAFGQLAAGVLADAGYRAGADPAEIDRPRVIGIVILLLAISAVSTGAYAAMLAELFPTRIRFSAMSLPQNVGNGWLGGLLPAIAFTIVAATGDIYAGLWYPWIITALCLVVCLAAVPETRGRDLH